MDLPVAGARWARLPRPYPELQVAGHHLCRIDLFLTQPRPPPVPVTTPCPTSACLATGHSLSTVSVRPKRYDVTFQTKIEIGLALIDRALEMGVPFIAVTSDGGYGDNPNFLDGLDERCLPDGSPLRYVVAVGCDFRVRKLDEIAQAEAEPVSPKAQGDVDDHASLYLQRCAHLCAGQTK